MFKSNLDEQTISEIVKRLNVLEGFNMNERLNYIIENYGVMRKQEERVEILKASLEVKLDDYNKRLSKIERFTTYLLDFFNPDNKLKDEIKKLNQKIVEKDKRIAEFEKKLKDLLNGN